MRGEGEKKNVIKIWLLTISSGFRDILDTNLAVFGSWRLMFFFLVLSSEETMVDFLYHAVFCEGDAAVMALFICHLSANCRLSTPG